VKHEEWCTEASRESGGWFGDAHLGSSNLSGVAGNEVIHSLLFAKLGDGWKHAEGIAGEEDDIGRVSRDTGNESVVDELDRVSSTGVLRERSVVEINVVVFVVHHIFEDSTIVERVVNIRLGFLGKIDRFGVAAAFDIEDAGVGPDVLVVSDKLAGGVGGEGGFTGAGEAERGWLSDWW